MWRWVSWSDYEDAASRGVRRDCLRRSPLFEGRIVCSRALTDPVALLAGTVGTTITRRGIRAGANDALALTGAAEQKGTSR